MVFEVSTIDVPARISTLTVCQSILKSSSASSFNIAGPGSSPILIFTVRLFHSVLFTVSVPTNTSTSPVTFVQFADGNVQFSQRFVESTVPVFLTLPLMTNVVFLIMVDG